MTVTRLAVALAFLGATAPPMASGAALKTTFGEALEAARDSSRLKRLASEVEAAEASLVTAAYGRLTAAIATQQETER